MITCGTQNVKGRVKCDHGILCRTKSEQKQTGLSLHRYLLRLRIHRATELLLSGSESISNIARMTGFSDANYFTQYFKMCVGVSPSTFRGDHTPKEG